MAAFIGIYRLDYAVVILGVEDNRIPPAQSTDEESDQYASRLAFDL